MSYLEFRFIWQPASQQIFITTVLSTPSPVLGPTTYLLVCSSSLNPHSVSLLNCLAFRSHPEHSSFSSLRKKNNPLDKAACIITNTTTMVSRPYYPPPSHDTRYLSGRLCAPYASSTYSERRYLPSHSASSITMTDPQTDDTAPTRKRIAVAVSFDPEQFLLCTHTACLPACLPAGDECPWALPNG